MSCLKIIMILLFLVKSFVFPHENSLLNNNKTDLEIMGIKQNIKKMIRVEINNKSEKKTIYTFNQKGCLLEIISYNETGETESIFKIRRDDKNFITEQNYELFDEQKNNIYKSQTFYKYKFSQNRINEIECYDFNKKLEDIIKYEYNKNGLVKKEFRKNINTNDITIFEYFYDNRNNQNKVIITKNKKNKIICLYVYNNFNQIIESISKVIDAKITIKTISKYNKNSDLEEIITYRNDKINKEIKIIDKYEFW